MDASVIVPFFNRSAFLNQTIATLLKQDTVFEYEIVLVDDGSTDDWESTILPDPRIVVVKQQNAGAAVARLNGVKHARGDIVVFHDSDDYALPNKIQVLVHSLKMHEDCVASFAGVAYASKIDVDPINQDKDSLVTRIRQPFRHFVACNYPIAAAMCIAVYRKYFSYIDSSSSKYRSANDYHLQFQLSMLGDFVKCGAVCLIYNDEHEDRITKQSGRLKQEMNAHLSLLENYPKLDPDEHLKEHYINRITHEGLRLVILNLSSIFFNKASRAFVVKYLFSYAPFLHLKIKIKKALT